MAQRLGIKTEFLKTDWQRGAMPEKIYDRLKKDFAFTLKFFDSF